jgi:hypothetical protein
LKTEKDSSFVSGTVTNEEGRFTLSKIKSGNYYLEVSIYQNKTKQALFMVISRVLTLKH